MKLVDIAYTAAERKEEAKDMQPTALGKYKGPEYPYGLCLTLNEETLAKLGIDELPKVGEELKVQAVAKVTSVSMRSDDKDEDERRVELQITKLACGEEAESREMSENATPPRAKRTLASYYREGKE
jgi:hypothetical protein